MKNQIYFLASVFSFFVLSCSQLSYSQDAQPTRWRFDVGDELRVELGQKTAIKTNIETRSQETENEMLLFMDWRIEAVNENVYSIEQSITRIQLTINTPGKSGTQTTTIDTDSDEKQRKLGGELLKQVEPLIGLKFQVTMTSRGEITNVTVPKESMNVIREAPLSMRIREVITEAGLKDLIGHSAIVFPENALKKGDDWSATVDLKSSIASISKTNSIVYEGAIQKDGVQFEQFSVTTEISPIEASEGASINDYSGGGKIWFALEKGNQILLESQMSNRMSTSRDFRDKTIVTVVTSNVSMKVTRK